jgi:hypothetical protein
MYSSFKQIREAMGLRASLVPLLYTLAAEAFATAIAPIRPLYYDYPEYEAAYTFAFEYMLGSDIIVRPVVDPIIGPHASATTVSVPTQVWLPPGSGWVDWNSSSLVPTQPGGAPLVLMVDATIDTLPMFVRAGAVLPLLPFGSLDVTVVNDIVWAVFPGAAAGRGSRYIDDGTTTAYEGGVSGMQNFRYIWSTDKRTLTCSIFCNITSTGSRRGLRGLRRSSGRVAPRILNGATAGLPDATPAAATEQDMLYTIELRTDAGGGSLAAAPFGRAVPKSCAFNGVAGTVSEWRNHSLARPWGTVLLHAKGRFPLAQQVNVTVIF